MFKICLIVTENFEHVIELRSCEAAISDRQLFHFSHQSSQSSITDITKFAFGHIKLFYTSMVNNQSAKKI